MRGFTPGFVFSASSAVNLCEKKGPKSIGPLSMTGNPKEVQEEFPIYFLYGAVREKVAIYSICLLKMKICRLQAGLLLTVTGFVLSAVGA
jgi:hypothetical protein